MRVRTTLVLAAILAGLLAYVFYVEEPRRAEEGRRKTLLTVTTDEVTGVTLTYADREIVLKKSEGTWRLVAPIDAPADSVTVSTVLTAVAQAEITKDLGDVGGNLAPYGLDQPFVRVTLTTATGSLPGLLVGKQTPVGTAAYAKLADAPNVVLTGGALRTQLDRQVKDLRDKTVLTFADAEVRRVELRGSGPEIVLAQQDGNWRLEQPVAMPADGTTVRGFLSSLRSLRAVDFPAETDARALGLDPPRLRITLRLGEEGAEKTLLVGASDAEKRQLYVQRAGQPTVYAVSDWVFRDLDKSVNDFRDKTILAFTPGDVTALTVAGPDGTARLTRGEGGVWRLEGSDQPVSTSAVTEYLENVLEVKGYTILADAPTDLAPYGLAPPQLTVTVNGADGAALGTLLIGSRQAESGEPEHTAMAGGGTTVFTVRDYLVKRLFKKPDAFLERPTPTPGGSPAPGDHDDEDADAGFELDDLGEE